MSEAATGGVTLEKVFLKISKISLKNTCVRGIVEHFYTNKTELCFLFVFITSIESVEKSLTLLKFLQVVCAFSR